MIHESKETKLLVKLCVAAMMAALVFAGNYMRVKIPVSLGGTTAFTLANILCALSGLLLGPWWGGLAAGLGSAIFDMLDPEYIVEAPITFVTKGMYGLVAGLVLYYLFRNAKEKYGPQLIATACAAVCYMVVYSVKVFFYNGMLIQGLPGADQCWLLVLSKMPATVFNGVVAMVGAPILGVAVMKALRSAHMGKLLA
ncbi:MAG: ECF transporter S component [Dysosmobacter welbionis]